MSNQKPFLKLVPSSVPAEKKQTIVPPELQALDGQPIAALKPDDNQIAEPVSMVRGKETANSIDFNLHHDGALMKFVERPNFAPQCLLVDGAGRQFGVVRNAEVADLISNAVNAFHLAHVMQLAEDQQKSAAENPGGEPPALLLPPVK